MSAAPAGTAPGAFERVASGQSAGAPTCSRALPRTADGRRSPAGIAADEGTDTVEDDKQHAQEMAHAKAPPDDETHPPPDAGEPMGVRDERPPMLGRRFRRTELTGMAVGLVVALIGHGLLSQTWNSRTMNGWSWLLAGIGGIAVGGALTLFLYGVSTDRDDLDEDKPHGRADVSTRGEWQRTVERRRRRFGGPRRNP